MFKNKYFASYMCSLFANENIPWSSISLNKCIQKEMPISLSVLHQRSILL